MDKYNIAVLVDAKQEYTHQLIQLLYQHIYVGIKSIYDAARDFCETTGDKHVLRRFQQLLSEVPKWNTDRIENEYARIKAISECDWMDDLITAVFVSHTKVLTAIQLKNKSKKSIELNVPTGEHFIHKCYTEVARAFWKRPYLMNHLLSNIDLQRNLADSEQLIKDSIHETVRRMLPVRHILKEYLGNDFNEDLMDTEEDITSQLSTATKNNLRRLVKQEIEHTLSRGGDDSGETNQSVQREESFGESSSESSAVSTTADSQSTSEPEQRQELSIDSTPSEEPQSTSEEQSNRESTSENNDEMTIVDKEEQPIENNVEEKVIDENVREIKLEDVRKPGADQVSKGNDVIVHKEEQEVIQLMQEYADVQKSQEPIKLEVEKVSLNGGASKTETISTHSAKDFERELMSHIENTSVSSAASASKESANNDEYREGEFESHNEHKKPNNPTEEYDMYSMSSAVSTSSAKKVASVAAPKERKPVFSFFDDACDY